MENVSLSDYYSEISKIRTRILSKYAHDDDIKPQELKRQTDPKSYCHLDLRKLDNHTERKPLLPKEDTHNVDDRVKKLDSVNDRIKDVLSQRRSVAAPINPSVQKYSTMSKKLQGSFGVREGKIPFIKKVVSQVQNENNIIESQVIHGKTYEVSRATFGKDSEIIESECRLFKDRQSYQDEQRERKSQFSFSSKVASRQDQSTAKKEAISMSLDDFKQRYMVSIPSLTETSMKYSEGNQVLQRDNKNEKIVQSTLQVLPRAKPSLLEKPYQKPEVVNSIDSNTNASKKLVQLLVRQVNLDIKLRDLKEQFQHFNNKQKWSLLKQQLAKINASMPQFQLEQWTKISPEQYNPFNACASNSTLSITQFAKRILQARQCWQKQLRQSVSISKLEDQQFSIRELDLGGKGYLTIEDLVCYINLNSDSYLRNRDVFSMFKRWCKIQGQDSLSRDCRIRYETFLNYVTS